MARYTVVVTDLGYKSFDLERKELTAVDAQLVLREDASPAGLVAACAKADGLLVRQSPITAELIGKMKQCKVIARYGVGVDNVDLPAATQAGIVVANVPNYCMEDVASHALALLLSCIRGTAWRDRRVRQGAWDAGAGYEIHRFSGRTLGLVGLGAIPQMLARMVSGFGMKLVAFDPFLPAGVAQKQGESDSFIVSGMSGAQNHGLLALRKYNPLRILLCARDDFPDDFAMGSQGRF